MVVVPQELAMKPAQQVTGPDNDFHQDASEGLSRRSSSGPVALLGTDLSGIVTVWSDGAEALFEWTEQEAVGRPIADLASWGLSRQDVREFLFVGTSGVWVHEHEVLTRNGNRMRLKTTASLVPGPDGLDEVIASAVRVVLPAGRVRLAMTERPFRALLEHGSDLVVLADRNLVIGYAGPSLPQMFGRLPRQVIGQSGWSYVHPEDVAALRGQWQAALSRPGSYRSLSLRIGAGRGSWRWIEVRISNLLADPSIAAVVLNIRDLTEQRQTAEALASSEHFLQSILDASLEGIWIVDTAGATVLANSRMAELLAVDHGRLAAGEVWDFFDSETGAMLRQRLRSRAAGVREVFEFEFERLDGQRRWLRSSAAPWYDRSGTYLGAIGMYSDLTEQKLREQAGEPLTPGTAAGSAASAASLAQAEAASILADRYVQRWRATAAVEPATADPASSEAAARESLPGLERLSRRELEVVRMLLLGDRVPVIARQLFISQSTVRNHLSSVFRKLRLSSQQELIVLLRERNPSDRTV